ncbi:Retrovirus-related Pol polyprotein from transposon opus [Gossypium australe]|uniref:Retrovirus-related Pol polyprotein from transposon opus n=1 Tax=Gossypium australe TaxID=47621 RepID=A0A5B6X321_9ROSI|nr:Retrovirus-related Pol polyprotein from transposon opus [Gossypium australe]
MPNYVKFMRGILSKKHRLGEFETVALTKGKFGIRQARPTKAKLQLVDHFYAHPKGKTKDVLITFNVSNTLKLVDENEECLVIDLIGVAMEEKFARFCHSNSDSDIDSLELNETNTLKGFSELVEVKQIVNGPGKKFGSLDLSVVIYVELTPTQEVRLLEVLRQSKTALGWIIADIKGISPAICIVLGHKISRQGIEVDNVKIDVIEKLLPPTSVKGIRSFLGHADL